MSTPPDTTKSLFLKLHTEVYIMLTFPIKVFSIGLCNFQTLTELSHPPVTLNNPHIKIIPN